MFVHVVKTKCLKNYLMEREDVVKELRMTYYISLKFSLLIKFIVLVKLLMERIHLVRWMQVE